MDITTAEKLSELGSKQAFAKLKQKYPTICLVHLYCLQGAIDSVDYNNLSTDVKEQLKKFVDNLKNTSL